MNPIKAKHDGFMWEWDANFVSGIESLNVTFTPGPVVGAG